MCIIADRHSFEGHDTEFITQYMVSSAVGEKGNKLHMYKQNNLLFLKELGETPDLYYFKLNIENIHVYLLLLYHVCPRLIEDGMELDENQSLDIPAEIFTYSAYSSAKLLVWLSSVFPKPAASFPLTFIGSDSSRCLCSPW